MSSILSMFNIEKALGEDGKPITPEVDYVSDFVRYVVRLILIVGQNTHEKKLKLKTNQPTNYHYFLLDNRSRSSVYSNQDLRAFRPLSVKQSNLQSKR